MFERNLRKREKCASDTTKILAWRLSCAFESKWEANYEKITLSCSRQDEILGTGKGRETEKREDTEKELNSKYVLYALTHASYKYTYFYIMRLCIKRRNSVRPRTLEISQLNNVKLPSGYVKATINKFDESSCSAIKSTVAPCVDTVDILLHFEISIPSSLASMAYAFTTDHD